MTYMYQVTEVHLLKNSSRTVATFAHTAQPSWIVFPVATLTNVDPQR